MNDQWASLFQKYSPDEMKKEAAGRFEELGIYPNSLFQKNETVFFIARHKGQKALVLFEPGESFGDFEGETQGPFKICGLNHENCERMRNLFAFMKPVSIGDRKFSLGLGDRLGLASPGHIRAIAGLRVFPVLAQQSMRELGLTGRTYDDVLDDASWSVFQEGYVKGFGADADHLKKKEQVEMALKRNYSMITLDCSDFIENRCFCMPEQALRERYNQLPEAKRQALRERYVSAGHPVDADTSIPFSEQELWKCALVYGPALDFMEDIFHGIIARSERAVDFEVSIDETTIPTSGAAHYFIASELKRRAVEVRSIAPRFCGEFQKGIDYIGDVDVFEKEFIVHAKIAAHFGHRVSVHSGSDKFGIFPGVGKHTGQRVHVKTAGTSWLEAVRLIASKSPDLYRRMHRFALSCLDEAKQYYHIGADPERIAPLDAVSDERLPKFLEVDDARQVLHITYGLILQARDQNGFPLFRDEIYALLDAYESEYGDALQKHIGRHLHGLGVTT